MSYVSAEHKNEEVLVWERTEHGRELKHYRAPYFFFVPTRSGEYTSIFGHSLDKVECKTREEFSYARQQYPKEELFEADITPDLKILSQHYYQVPAPKLHVTFLDIEVDYNPQIGFSTIENPYAPVNSIAMYHQWENRMVIYAVPPEDDEEWTDEKLLEEMSRRETLPDDVDVEAYVLNNERELLLYVMGEIEDSDVLCGWNSDFFDIPYLGKRLLKLPKDGKKWFNKLSFELARAPRFREVPLKTGKINTTLDLRGRINADYMVLFKKYEMAERPSYKLENIADEILPDLPKLKYEGTLHSLYRKDFAHFCRYNLRDTEVLKGFEERLGYVALANEMYHLSTGQFSHVTGTLKLAELAINNYCIHELGARVPNTKESGEGSIAGAFVLTPHVGMHEWIGSIDINSLYPSAIRSINISPERIIGQFKEKIQACEEIAKKSSVNLTLNYDDAVYLPEEVRGHSLTLPAHVWNEQLWKMQLSVSGYGTVFDQKAKGIIPSILEDWYATRKKYQKMMREAENPLDKAYYNRLQYVYKIKLNSLYGALTNAYFKYYDLRMGESTTGTGRMILLHQCAEACRILDGEYMWPDIHEVADDGRHHYGYSKKWSVVYGDTDSSYFITHAQNEEEAVEFADAIGEMANKSFPKFMRERFLCQPGFDQIIKTGREIVASKGIFVEKKRYILRIVDSEGDKVDKLKVMGLDTKKTTLPLEVSKVLNNFVGRLLKGEEWDAVAKDVVDYKTFLETTDDIMLIGLPRGVNKVEDYTSRWTNDSTTRLPGHVAAAIHYNMLLKQYNDNESLQITSGMKIKVFYLTQKYGQFHSIALPVDLEFVPKWFLENYTIDRKMHIERLVDNPLGNIIKAIGRDVPSKQSLVVDDLLDF